MCDACRIPLSVGIFKESVPQQLSFSCGLGYNLADSSVSGAFASGKFPGIGVIECWRACVRDTHTEGERENLCLCCVFSAVPSGFGHSLPCEACRENISHGVIMSCPPRHTLSFPKCIPPPSLSITVACWSSPFFPFSTTKQDFMFSLGRERKCCCHSLDVRWAIGHVHLCRSLFHMQWQCKWGSVCTASCDVTVCLCISAEHGPNMEYSYVFWFAHCWCLWARMPVLW